MKFIRWSNCKRRGYRRFCSGRVLFRFTSTPFHPSFRASFYWQSDLHLNLFVAPTPEEMERENFGSWSGVAWRKWHTFYFYLRPAFTVPWERFSLMHGLPGGCFRASLPTYGARGFLRDNDRAFTLRRRFDWWSGHRWGKLVKLRRYLSSLTKLMNGVMFYESLYHIMRDTNDWSNFTTVLYLNRNIEKSVSFMLMRFLSFFFYLRNTQDGDNGKKVKGRGGTRVNKRSLGLHFIAWCFQRPFSSIGCLFDEERNAEGNDCKTLCWWKSRRL